MNNYSIIIVNYYCVDDILNCIDSLEYYISDREYEIIIVSNSPVSANEEHRLSNKNNVTVLKLDDNYGLGYALNKGAEKSGFDMLAFLNPDLILHNDVFSYVDNQLAHDIGAIGPDHLDENGNSIPSVQQDIDLGFFLRWMVNYRKLTKNGSDFDKKLMHATEPVDVVNGSAIFVKKDIFLKAGAFDPGFFLYWEENDLCIKIRKLGYKVLFLKEAKVVHYEHATTNKNFMHNQIIKHQSQKYFISKHYPSYVTINRISGIMSYLLRLFFSLIIYKPSKIKYYYNLLDWYLFKYK